MPNSYGKSCCPNDGMSPWVQPLIVLRCCGSKPLRKASWQHSPLKWRSQSSQLLVWFDKNQGKNTKKDISTTGVLSIKMCKVLLGELSIASSGAWTGRRGHVMAVGHGSTVSQTKKVIMVVGGRPSNDSTQIIQ